MKTIVCLLGILIYCSSSLFAQTSAREESNTPTQVRRIVVMAHANYSDYEFYVTPGIGFKAGKHSVFGGPLLFNHYSRGLTTVGGFAGYTFEPEFRYKRISSFVLFHVQQGNYFNDVHTIEMQAGYGLSVRILNRLFLDQSFSGGAIYYWRDFDNNPYQWTDLYFSMMLRIGLRYEFELRKKEKTAQPVF